MSKRKYYGWNACDMEEALEKSRCGFMGFNEVCRHYNIPKPTFRRHLKNLNSHSKNGRPKDLSTAMEQELVKHILQLESCFFGLTIADLRRLAFELAEKYGLDHRFNKENKMAGWKWYYKFIKSHPEISLRAPEATSMARCKGFNKQRVMDFFDKYEGLLDDHKFTNGQIFNVDETGLSTVHKPPKILAKKGKSQVGAVTSGERGQNTTCVCCMNAAGEFIPPMLIFKRMRMCDSLKRGGPPNTLFTCSESGWITKELFCEWLQHFIKCTRLQKSDIKQILLLLDGHTTHTKNIEAIRLARDYGIVMLCLPAHTTHKLQPLDKSFFKSLKSNFYQASSNWIRSNPGKVIKQDTMSELLGIAYPKVVRMDIALNGFRACGLWPSDRNVIREEDFVSVEENEALIFANDTEPQQSNSSTAAPVISQQNLALSAATEIGPEPSTSSAAALSIPTPDSQPNRPNQQLESDTASIIRTTIRELSPIPSLKTTKARMTKGTTAAQVITTSPYKQKLEENAANTKKKIKIKIKTEKIFQSMKNNNKKKKKDELANTNKKGKVETWFCKLCTENRKENMIECTQCKTWVHDLCAGVDQQAINYVCDLCKHIVDTSLIF